MHRWFLTGPAALTLALGVALPAHCGEIYVSNEGNDTVVVLDSDSLEIQHVIETGGRPRDMRFSPDGSELLIAASEADRIEVLDLETKTITGYIDTGDDPELFDIDPSGEILVVSNEDDAEATVIDIASGTIRTVIEDVGIEPEGVTFTPDGKRVFVTAEATNTIAVIDPWEGVILADILVGNRPRRGTFTPDGREYWVTNELGGTVSVIDSETLQVSHTISFEKKGLREADITPVDLVMTKDGTTAFVTLGRAWHVARVDVATRTVEAYILAGSRVWGAALTADDSILVVTNGASDDISVIDTEANRAVRSVAVGRTPHTVRIRD